MTNLFDEDVYGVAAVASMPEFGAFMGAIASKMEHIARQDQYPLSSGNPPRPGQPRTDFREQWASGVEEFGTPFHYNAFLGDRDWHAIFVEKGFRAVGKKPTGVPSGRTSDFPGRYIMLRALSAVMSEMGML